MRYLHPDKSYAVNKVLVKGRKKPTSDGLTMIERMARQLHAERTRGTRVR